MMALLQFGCEGLDAIESGPDVVFVLGESDGFCKDGGHDLKPLGRSVAKRNGARLYAFAAFGTERDAQLFGLGIVVTIFNERRDFLEELLAAGFRAVDEGDCAEAEEDGESAVAQRHGGGLLSDNA